MKKIFVLFAALLFAVVFMGCGNLFGPDNSGDDSTSVTWPAGLVGTWKGTNEVGSEQILTFNNKGAFEMATVRSSLLPVEYFLESIQNDVYHIYETSGRVRHSEADYTFIVEPNGTLTIAVDDRDGMSIWPGTGFVKQ
jgi:hypothetical protein